MENGTSWTTYEANLQQYRVISISAQAFFLVIGVLLYDKNIFLFSFIGAIGLVHIWYIWFRIVLVRARILDYYKYQCIYGKKSKTDPKGICSEKEYVIYKKDRETTNKILGMSTNWRLTRVKLDILLPIAFTLIWTVLLCFTWAEYLSAHSHEHHHPGIRHRHFSSSYQH